MPSSFSTGVHGIPVDWTNLDLHVRALLVSQERRTPVQSNCCSRGALLNFGFQCKTRSGNWPGRSLISGNGSWSSRGSTAQVRKPGPGAFWKAGTGPGNRVLRDEACACERSLSLRSDQPMSNCCSRGTILHVGLLNGNQTRDRKITKNANVDLHYFVSLQVVDVNVQLGLTASLRTY